MTSSMPNRVVAVLSHTEEEHEDAYGSLCESARPYDVLILLSSCRSENEFCIFLFRLQRDELKGRTDLTPLTLEAFNSWKENKKKKQADERKEKAEKMQKEKARAAGTVLRCLLCSTHMK